MRRNKVNRVLNRTIMFGSPIEEIANMFDEKIPEYIEEIVSLVDKSSKDELLRWIEYGIIGNWDEDYLAENRQDLLVYVAAEFFEMTDYIQSEKRYDFYDDYLIYIFFFMQYRMITGKNLKSGMKFNDILKDYRNITDENIWKKFVYSDDPEGERDYNLFLYDEYELDFLERNFHINYVDKNLSEKYTELMCFHYSNENIGYLRSFDLIEYLSPNLNKLFHDLNDEVDTEKSAVIYKEISVENPEINIWKGEDNQDKTDSDKFLMNELPFKELPFEELSAKELLFCDLPFDDNRDGFGENMPEEESINSDLFASEDFLEIPDIDDKDELPWNDNDVIFDARKEVENYIIWRVSYFTEQCVENLYHEKDASKKEKIIDEYNENVKSLYGKVSWTNVDKDLSMKRYKADVREFFTEEEMKALIEANEKTINKIQIYNCLWNLGKTQYINEIVKHLKNAFSYIKPLINFQSEKQKEENAVEELFLLAEAIAEFYNPVFDAILKLKGEIQFISIRNPYNVRHEVIAMEELRLDNMSQPSDAWLLQEQIYLCAYLFEELCMILQLLVVHMDEVGDRDEAKRIANGYRYFFRNMTCCVFQDYLDTDTYVNSIRYSKKEKSHNNIIVDNLLIALNKMLETDDINEIAVNKVVMINSLKILGANEELIENVLTNLEMALIEKCKNEIGYEEIKHQVTAELEVMSVDISDTTKNTLATAEYFYKKYIIDSRMTEQFDYSCFAILYYQVLESAFNELIYIPYKARYSARIVQAAQENNGMIENLSYVPNKVTNMLVKRSGKFFMAEQLTLGAFAYFCSSIGNNNKVELQAFVKDIINDTNISQIASFGNEIMEISRKRNVAAHATECLSADSFIESKNYVFNKQFTTEYRNMLWRFLNFFK